MSHTVDCPIFLYPGAIVVVPFIHDIGVTTWHLSICGTRWAIKAGIVGVVRSKMIGLHPLLHDLLAVERIYQVVACPMKDDGWYDTSSTAHSVVGSLPLLRWIGPSLA